MAQTDAIIDVLKGIDTSLRIRHDPEAERIVAAFGYEAALTFPRRRQFYDYDDYLDALQKWKAVAATGSENAAAL